MKPTTQEELLRVRDANEAWLQQQHGFNASYIGDADGQRTLILHFHPLTAETRDAVHRRFEGYPIKVVEAPMAMAQSKRD